MTEIDPPSNEGMKNNLSRVDGLCGYSPDGVKQGAVYTVGRVTPLHTPTHFSDLNNVLYERGTTYGDFIDNATVSQGLKTIIHNTKNWHNLDSDQQEMCDMICSKLSRMLTGDPNHLDTYVDIQGFAKLVEDRLRKAGTNVPEHKCK